MATIKREKFLAIQAKKGEKDQSDQKTTQKTTQKIVALIEEDPYITTEDMAIRIGIIRRNIAKNIKKLQKQGLIRRVGPDKGGYWEVIEQQKSDTVNDTSDTVNDTENV